MSFVINIMENDTLKYWKKRLKHKWYKIPFLMSKNLEIEVFMSGFDKPEKHEYNGPKKFGISSKINNISNESKVAIVVPIYINSFKAKNQVERLIESIKNQNRKPDYVFFIDDCSPMEYDSCGFEVHKMERNGGPAKARNFGIDLVKKVGADIIAFTDSDVVLPSEWIENIISTFIENRYMQAISGKTISYGKTWYDLYHNVNGTLNGRRFKDSKQLLYGPTCNLSVSTEFLSNLKFSTDFPLAAGEDIEFCFQFLENDNNIGYGDNVIVYHDFGYEPLAIKKNKQNFIKIFKKYAKGEHILLNKIPFYYYLLNNTKEISNKL